MAFTLSNLLYAGLSSLGQTVEEVASATGTTGTSKSDKLSGKFNDGDLKGGTLFVLRDAGGASAAPESEFGAITDNSDDGTTLTITHDALTAASDSGDRLGIAKPMFPIQTMIQRANDALRNIGFVPLPDTSITTVDNQTEYTLPVALKRAKIIRVEVQSILNLSNNNGWIPVPNHREVVASAGTTGTIILPQFPAGYSIRITYLGQHPSVNAYSDVISEYINPILATKALEVEALNWLISSKGQSATNFETQRWNKAQSEFEQAKALHPVVREPAYPKFAVFNEPWNPIPPIGTVRL